jgi:hypothetical protein
MTWGPIERDKAWAAKFVPRVKEILGGALIREGTEDEDLTEATDLKIVTLGEAAVAKRILSADLLPKMGHGPRYVTHKHAVSIRHTREGCPHPIEWAKIFEQGHGDYYAYGWANERKDALVAWAIVDLHEWRRKHLRFAADTTPSFGQTGYKVTAWWYSLTTLRYYHERLTPKPARPIIVAASDGLLDAPDPRCVCEWCRKGGRVYRTGWEGRFQSGG